MAEKFFKELEEIIGEIKVNPIIIIFTSTKKLNSIKDNIISLNKFSLFDPNLIFDNFGKVKNILISENKYDSNINDNNQIKENVS